MIIPTREQILNILRDKNISIIDGNYSYPENCHSVLLEPEQENALNMFVHLAMIEEVKTLFVDFGYWTEDRINECLIDPNNSEELTDLDSKILTKIKKQIDVYNKKVKSIPLNSLIRTEIFLFSKGIHYVIVFGDDRITQLDPEEELQTILEKYDEEIQSYKDSWVNQRRAKSEAAKEGFINVLISDENFAYCTNKTLRRNFVMSKLSEQNFDGIDIYNASEIVEMAWGKLQSKKIK